MENTSPSAPQQVAPGECAQERVSTTRLGRDPELVAKATALRLSGLPWKEVGRALGISHQWAFDLVNDPKADRHRQRNRAYYRKRSKNSPQLSLFGHGSSNSHSAATGGHPC